MLTPSHPAQPMIREQGIRDDYESQEILTWSQLVPLNRGSAFSKFYQQQKNLCKIISQLLNCGQVLPFLVINHSRGHNSQNSTTKNCIILLFPIFVSKQVNKVGACYSDHRPSAKLRNSFNETFCLLMATIKVRNNEYG